MVCIRIVAFEPNRDLIVTLLLLSPCHVDDARGAGRRPRHDDSFATMDASASSQLIVANGLAVKRGRNFVDVNMASRSFHGYRRRSPSFMLRPQRLARSRRRQQDGGSREFSPALCLERCGAAVDDTRVSGVRMPSAMSRNDDGTRSFPPTAMFPTLCQTTPRSPPLVFIAIVPRMRPARDSQAWETGGSMLDTTARTDFSLSPTFQKGIFPRPRAAGGTRAHPSSEKTEGSAAVLGRLWAQLGIFADSRPPEARTGSLGEISDEGGTPTPLTAFTRGQREVLCAHLSRKGLCFGIFGEPVPSEACAGSLGEERGRGRVPLALLLMNRPILSMSNRRRPARALQVNDAEGVGYPALAGVKREVLRRHRRLIRSFFSDPKPPEACARSLGRRKRQGAGSLGGGLRKGWVTPTPRAGPKSVAAPPCAHGLLTFRGPPAAGGLRAHPR
ncbi:hypothetical protein EV122DRAFT_254254 [Schizophyllum commune]